MKYLMLATLVSASTVGMIAAPAPTYAADNPGYVKSAKAHTARRAIYAAEPQVVVMGGPAFDMPPATFTPSPEIIWNPFPPSLSGYTYRNW